jgi:hypothetical protein
MACLRLKTCSIWILWRESISDPSFSESLQDQGWRWCEAGLVGAWIADTIRQNPLVAMDALQGQQLFQSRLCQQLSLLTAVSESLTERMLQVEFRLQELEQQMQRLEGPEASDWEGAAALLSATESRLSRLERRLGSSVVEQQAPIWHEADPFPEEESQEFPVDAIPPDHMQPDGEEEQGLLVEMP